MKHVVKRKPEVSTSASRAWFLHTYKFILIHFPKNIFLIYLTVRYFGFKNSEQKRIIWLAYLETEISHCLLYAVKAQTSLAPLSWFPGSRIPTAHMHQCCRFQSYANSHAIAYEIYKRNLQRVNRIPGIHDNGPPERGLWRLTLTAYCTIYRMAQKECNNFDC